MFSVLVVLVFFTFYFCFQSFLGSVLLTTRIHSNTSVIKQKEEKHEAFSYSLYPESRKIGITVFFLSSFSISVALMAFEGQQGRSERVSKLSVPASLETSKGEYPSWTLSLSAMRQGEKKEPYTFLRHFLHIQFSDLETLHKFF